MTETNFRRGAFLLFLLAATALVYAQTTRFSFLAFDDTPSIVNNETMRHWSSVPEFFTTDVWQGVHPNSLMYYRPLFLCWLLLNFKLFGLHGGLWHAAAIVLYLAGVYLAWRLARKFTGDEFMAAAAALLFAVHPLHVESVAWLSAAVDPLVSVFFFGGFLAYFRWRESGRREWLLACGSLVALSLFTKEAGAALPVLIALYEWLFPSRPETPVRRTRSSLAATLAIPVSVYAVARALALASLVKTQDHRSWLDVLRMAPKLICVYLAKALWPAHVAAWYDIRLIHELSFADFYLPLAVAAGLAALTIWALLKKRFLGFCLLWWWVALGPAVAGVLTLPEFDLAHDRYSYLSLFGLCLAFAGLLRMLPNRGVRVFGFAAPQSLPLLAATGILAALSAAQVNNWKNDVAMYSHAIEVSPRAIRPHALLGNEYLKHARFNDAIRLYSETRDLDPGNWRTNYAYAAALYRAGHPDDALPIIQHTVQLESKADPAYLLWAQILRGKGKNAEADRVLEAGIRAVENPELLKGELDAARAKN